MLMDGNDIRSHLARVGEVLETEEDVEILLIGGAGGVLAGELRFVRTYLTMLRVPSRGADLDQLQAAMRLLEAYEEGGDE